MTIRQNRAFAENKKSLGFFSRRVNIEKTLSVFLPILFFLTYVWSCAQAASNTTLFASAGAKPAIDEICQKYKDRHGIIVKVIYGGGGEVLSEMILSRSGDVYIAPEQRFMEAAEEKEAIIPATKKIIAYMVPVIAVSKGNPNRITVLADLAGPGIRVAITRPETTLLGKFAPDIFRKAGLAVETELNLLVEDRREAEVAGEHGPDQGDLPPGRRTLAPKLREDRAHGSTGPAAPAVLRHLRAALEFPSGALHISLLPRGRPRQAAGRRPDPVPA